MNGTKSEKRRLHYQSIVVELDYKTKEVMAMKLNLIPLLMKKGMTYEEAVVENDRRNKQAISVPCDFGPDWIDSPETIRQHFEEEALKGNINVVIVRRLP